MTAVNRYALKKRVGHFLLGAVLMIREKALDVNIQCDFFLCKIVWLLILSAPVYSDLAKISGHNDKRFYNQI